MTECLVEKVALVAVEVMQHSLGCSQTGGKLASEVQTQPLVMKGC